MEDERTRLLDQPLVARSARWGIISWAALGVVALGFLFVRYVIFPIRIIFPPLVVALILVYLLNPIIRWLQQRWGVPRFLGALGTYLLFLTAIGLALAYLTPIIADQVRGFASSVPDLFARAQGWFGDVLAPFGVETEGPRGIFSAPENQQAFLDFLGRLLSLTRGLFGLALAMFIGLILSFYLLVDLPKIQQALTAFVPERRRPEMLSIVQRLGRALGGFFRGQLLVALFVGLASTLVLFVVGLPYWALVGMISGLFNLIPLIGPFIGAIFAVLVAFTTETGGHGLLGLAPGWPLAIGSLIALTVVQQIDNHIMSPNIVARTVKLHPVTVMLALLAGGTMLGLWGILLAVPVVASAKILLLHAWDTQMTWPPPEPEEAVGATRQRPGGVRRWWRSRPAMGDEVPVESAEVAGKRSTPAKATSDGASRNPPKSRRGEGGLRRRQPQARRQARRGTPPI